MELATVEQPASSEHTGLWSIMIVQMERFSIFTVSEMTSTHTIRRGHLRAKRVFKNVICTKLLVMRAFRQLSFSL